MARPRNGLACLLYIEESSKPIEIQPLPHTYVVKDGGCFKGLVEPLEMRVVWKFDGSLKRCGEFGFDFCLVIWFLNWICCLFE